MAFAGSLKRQAQLIHHYCTKDQPPSIGLTLGVLKSPAKHRQVADVVADNVRSMMSSKMVKGNSSNDSIGFRNTVILGIVPTAPAETEPVTVLEEYDKGVKMIADQLGFTPAMTKSAFEMGKHKREVIAENELLEKNQLAAIAEEDQVKKKTLKQRQRKQLLNLLQTAKRKYLN